MTIRVLIIEDSRIFQRVIEQALQSDPRIKVIGCASDPYQAREIIVKELPDVITLDINLPRMNGLDFLKRLMQYQPLPTVVISSLTYEGSQEAMDAFALGAAEVLPKPQAGQDFNDIAYGLCNAVRAASLARVRSSQHIKPSAQKIPDSKNSQRFHGNSLIAIGASTGGTEAIKEVITRLPAHAPCVLITQHMPPVFTKSFAERLDSLSAMKVLEAQGGEELLPGHAYVAPGGYHMIIEKHGAHYHTALSSTAKIHFQRPAVDVLFESIANTYNGAVAACVLTGMGRDGANGLMALKSAGAATCAQDQATSVVYGMPKVAAESGATSTILAIQKIASFLTQSLTQT